VAERRRLLGWPVPSTEEHVVAQISTADFKNGITLEIDNQLLKIVEFQHVNPGKGAAFVRTKLKNARSGAVLEKTFRAGERLQNAVIDTRGMQVLYRDGDDFVFMDTSSYDQIPIPIATIGEQADFLIPNLEVDVSFHDDTVIGISLPASVSYQVVDTEPGIQGDRVSGATKPATLETGKVVRVPLFVEQGDQIVVDTRSGDYLSRG
jgi:elongation factor P